MRDSKTYRGRIAPTPSGFLHLGHIATFKTACERAKLFNGKIILRIEDIDSSRSREIYIEQIFKDLKSVGIVCDEGAEIGGKFAPYYQSKRLDFYKKRLEFLIAKGFAYPSNASRQEIKNNAKISANKDFPEAIFPTNLRPKNFEIPKDIFAFNWRFKVPENLTVEFFDELMGKQKFTCQIDFGDFLVWRKTGEPSYELAVVSDDIDMEITEVVRGSDLLLSTARQILLYRAFDETPPKFAHCPLLKYNGKKLSKSVLKNDKNNPFLVRNNSF